MKKYFLIAIMAIAIIGCTKDDKTTPDKTPSGPTNQELIAAEKQALVDIYNNNGGADWAASDNWLSDQSVDQWHGITVNDEGFITAINLSINYFEDNKVFGALDFTAFTKLTSINIGSNTAVTAIDISKNTELTEIYADITAIESIDITNNPKLEIASLIWCKKHLKNIAMDYSHIPAYFKFTTWGDQDKAQYSSPKHCDGFQYPEFTYTNFNQADFNKNTASDKAALLTMINNPDLTVTGTLNWDNNIPLSQWDYITTDNLERAIAINCETTDLFSGALTFSGIDKLTDIYITNNSELTSVKVSDLPTLEYLNFNINAINSIEISNTPTLDFISFEENQLSSLDVSSITSLTEIYCYNNNISSLDVSSLKNLTSLDCRENGLTSLKVAGLSNMTYLNLNNNSITSLDLSGLNNIKDLYCEDNALVSLDIDKLPLLEYFHCSNNNLTSLDVSTLTELKGLRCNGNAITSLVIENKPILKIVCSNNNLTYLKLSDLPNLQYVDCMNNQLTHETFIKNNIPESTYIMF